MSLIYIGWPNEKDRISLIGFRKFIWIELVEDLYVYLVYIHEVTPISKPYIMWTNFLRDTNKDYCYIT